VKKIGKHQHQAAENTIYSESNNIFSPRVLSKYIS
jgi:hypothetical protein